LYRKSFTELLLGTAIHASFSLRHLYDENKKSYYEVLHGINSSNNSA